MHTTWDGKDLNSTNNNLVLLGKLGVLQLTSVNLKVILNFLELKLVLTVTHSSVNTGQHTLSALHSLLQSLAFLRDCKRT